METAAARCPMPKRMSHGGPPADIRIDAASTVSHVGTITLTVLAFGQRPDRANSNSLAGPRHKSARRATFLLGLNIRGTPGHDICDEQDGKGIATQGADKVIFSDSRLL